MVRTGGSVGNLPIEIRVAVEHVGRSVVVANRATAHDSTAARHSGTDTGVGKTLFSTGLDRSRVAAAPRGVMKPSPQVLRAPAGRATKMHWH